MTDNPFRPMNFQQRENTPCYGGDREPFHLCEEGAEGWQDAELQSGFETGLNDSLITIVKLFGIKHDAAVIYAGSGTNIGVAEIFLSDGVTHVDPDAHAMASMKASGLNAVAMPIERYMPQEPADVLVALDMPGNPTRATVDCLVKPGGYVIASDWTGWAGKLFDLKDQLEIQGAVAPAYDNSEPEFMILPHLPRGEGASITAHLFNDQKDVLFVFRRVQPT